MMNVLLVAAVEVYGKSARLPSRFALDQAPRQNGLDVLSVAYQTVSAAPPFVAAFAPPVLFYAAASVVFTL